MNTIQYRFINTGEQDAALNMAIDEAILLHAIEGKAVPTLRVFRWKQPAISLGRFQNIEQEIASAVCQQRGVELVRRPTGGRAVYHHDEFTYSIVIGKRDGVPAGVVAAYSYLAQGLIAALHDLGVPAELSQGRVSKQPEAACFAASTQADLTSNGYKLIGSAQVWRDETLLQQGSLPLEDRSAEFYTMLHFSTEEARQRALHHYREQTTPLHTFAPLATWEDVAHAFRQGFSHLLNTEFIADELLPSEWDLAHQLAEEKYKKLAWQTKRINLV